MSNKIEFKVVTVPANDASALTTTLNSYGADGWDIVTILPLAGGDQAVYLKKDKRDR